MIKFYISELTNTKNAILQMKAEVDGYYHELSKVVREINMQVRIRQEIDATLEQAKKKLLKEKEYLQDLANTVEACLNEYIEAEKIGDMPATNLVLDSQISSDLLGTLNQ